MSTSDVPVQLDDELAGEVTRRAARRGEPPEQLVSEVLRRHFLLEIFERIWDRDQGQLSEDQALALSYEELDTMRAERDAGGPS